MAASPRRQVDLVIRGPIRRADLRGLHDRVCALLTASPGAVVDATVTAIEPDAVVVEALAMLALGARRHGCEVRLRDPSPGLCDLVEFMGLSAVFAGLSPLVEPAGQPEEREQRVGGEEEGELADPPVA